MAERKEQNQTTPVGELRKWLRETKKENRIRSIKDREEFVKERPSREQQNEKKIARPKSPEVDL